MKLKLLRTLGTFWRCSSSLCPFRLGLAQTMRWYRDMGTCEMAMMRKKKKMMALCSHLRRSDGRTPRRTTAQRILHARHVWWLSSLPNQHVNIMLATTCNRSEDVMNVWACVVVVVVVEEAGNLMALVFSGKKTFDINHRCGRKAWWKNIHNA